MDATVELKIDHESLDEAVEQADHSRLVLLLLSGNGKNMVVRQSLSVSGNWDSVRKEILERFSEMAYLRRLM